MLSKMSDVKMIIGLVLILMCCVNAAQEEPAESKPIEMDAGHGSRYGRGGYGHGGGWKSQQVEAKAEETKGGYGYGGYRHGGGYGHGHGGVKHAKPKETASVYGYNGYGHGGYGHGGGWKPKETEGGYGYKGYGHDDSYGHGGYGHGDGWNAQADAQPEEARPRPWKP